VTRPVAPILVEEQQPGQPPHVWPVEHGIRVVNGLHDIAAIMQGGNERPIELDRRQEEYALPRAPAHAHGFPPPSAHDWPYAAYVAPGWPAGRGPHTPQVHLVNQHFVPVAFLLEFQGVIRNIVALGVDPRPTPAQRFEVKERFTGLITDGAGEQALLVQHLEPVLRQLIANQMFGLRTYQVLAAGVFIESTVQRGGISLLFLGQHSSEARAVGWFPGPSGASGFGGRLPRLKISAYHATGEGQHHVVASRWFQRGVGSVILPRLLRARTTHRARNAS